MNQKYYSIKNIKILLIWVGFSTFWWWGVSGLSDGYQGLATVNNEGLGLGLALYTPNKLGLNSSIFGVQVFLELLNLKISKTFVF